MTWLALRDFSLDLATPLATASGEITARDGTLLRVDIGDASGIGEATPLTGWTESLADCRRVLRTVQDGTRLAGEAGPAARHGLTVAIRDALARHRDVAFVDTLGSNPAATVPVNATLGDAAVDATVAMAERAVAAGTDTLKLKVGVRDPEHDLARLRGVRDAVGEEIAVRADANGAWDRPTAAQVVDAVPWLEYLEQPLPADDLAGHARLRARDGAPIALDESLSVHTPATVLSADAADVLVAKPMALGGPERTLAVANAAAARGVDTVVTTTIDAAVARTAAVHVAAALPGDSGRAHGLATAARLTEDVTADPAPVVDGQIAIPDGPGLAGDAFTGLVD